MPGRGTPRHAVRVPDELWQTAVEIAKHRGETLTEVVREALERYVDEHRDELDGADTQ